MTPNPPKRTQAAAALLAFGFGLFLVPLHPTDAAARRPAAETTLPPEVAQQEDLPIPPIPPETPPAFSAAPVPDSELAPTPDDPDASGGAHLGPGLFTQRNFGEGNGYLNGSTMQSERDRKTPPAGFQLNMPLQ
jgi:hypothetical protein